MKRLFDLIVVMVAGMLFAIPMFALAIAVWLSSKGPILYWSQRIGKGNAVFNMPKFRTMRIETPVLPSHLLENPDVYLTPIGSFLRRSSLDELPQLWCILRGDMSVVGPRPALSNQQDLIDARTAKGIHLVKPGLTGWAQVNGRDEIELAKKVQLDYEYLDKKSLIFDLYVVLLTFYKVVKREGIKH
ncbi:sugar transferase [Aquirufa sp.]|jgi:O-antigen biosynthesis protein WbqP|uniref:sugar transferase n=1 Tax=Aquirufa sp. TaxID=2676249 RepID=UPI0037BE963F